MSTSPSRLCFPPFILDLTTGTLENGIQSARLKPQTTAVLRYLVEHAGQVVRQDELLAALWPNVRVGAGVLKTLIWEIRQALDDQPQAPRFIETLPRRGYRFVAPVEVSQPAEITTTCPSATDRPIATEQHGLDQAGAGSLSIPGQPTLPSALPAVPGPARAPRAPGFGLLEAERRQLTVLVCRLVGVSEHAECLDPGELFEVVSDYRALGAEIVHRFAGQRAQDQGDRLVVYFGYPQAHEDDARRAVHAGLGMVEGMAECIRRFTRRRGVRLAVRVGIHTGVVVVSTTRKDEREQLILGDTPTIAAQIQELAAPDTVVVSLATLRLVEGYFDYQALGAHRLDAHGAPLTVYQILEENTAQRGLTRLVGREHELGLLCERWAQVKDGLGQVVLLSGEAGIGKSRLVQALKEHLAGEAYTRVECRCSPYYQNTTLYPVVTHVQRLLRWHKGETAEEKLRKLEEALQPYGLALAEAVPLLATLLSLPLPDRYVPLTLTPQRQKQKTLEILLAWLLAEVERQPMCFIVEDLHWADASTLEWLSLLIEQVPTTRLLLLLVFRPDFRPPWAPLLPNPAIPRPPEPPPGGDHDGADHGADPGRHTLAGRGAPARDCGDGWRTTLYRGVDQDDPGVRTGQGAGGAGCVATSLARPGDSRHAVRVSHGQAGSMGGGQTGGAIGGSGGVRVSL